MKGPASPTCAYTVRPVEATVWAAWAGALVSAVGAGIVLWVRWRDRPQVTWHFGVDAIVTNAQQKRALMRHGRTPYRFIRLTNVGDGSAYAVTVSGNKNLDAQLILITEEDTRGFSILSVAGRLAPDDLVLVAVWVIPDEPTAEPQGGVIAGTRDLIVEWTEGPVRHGRHRKQMLRMLGDPVGAGDVQQVKDRDVNVRTRPTGQS